VRSAWCSVGPVPVATHTSHPACGNGRSTWQFHFLAFYVSGVHPQHLQKLLTLSPVPAIVVGIFLLTLGRKLFWLFVAAIGFMAGVELATRVAPHDSGWILIGGIVLGIVGALLALAVQKVAIGLGGFLAGGYYLMTAAHTWKMVAPDYEWAAFLVGGVVGAILMLSVFNWALIIFSSIGGAHLILRAIPADPAIASVILVALAVVGCLFQAKAFGRKPVE